MHNILIVMALLQCKHLIVDWCWQPEFEWKNKGIYGHFGGIRHAMKNAIGTMLCFAIVIPSALWIQLPLIFAVDYVIHYHIDFGKMNINRITGWGPLTHPQFWWLTGFDKFLHQATYLGLIWWILG